MTRKLPEMVFQFGEFLFGFFYCLGVWNFPPNFGRCFFQDFVDGLGADGDLAR